MESSYVLRKVTSSPQSILAFIQLFVLTMTLLTMPSFIKYNPSIDLDYVSTGGQTYMKTHMPLCLCYRAAVT